MIQNKIYIDVFSPSHSNRELFQQLPTRIYGALSPKQEQIDPEAECLLAMFNDKPVARLSILATDNLKHAPGLSGVIGHYEALDAEAGILLLNEAKAKLKDKDVKRVIGPMNGSTWGRYRLALAPQSGDPVYSPPIFFSEPLNPSEYPEHFIKAGFNPIDHYESRIVNDLNARLAEMEQLARKMARLGVTTESVDLARFDEYLAEIFEMSVHAFANNMYYRDIGFAEFSAMYQKMKPLLDPDFVRLAYDSKRRLVGFALGFPDLYSNAEGLPKRLIYKTLATREEMRGSGLGVYLLDELHQVAYRKGYQAVIHALMHCDNNSLKLSKRCYNSVIFKRYALFGVTL